MKEVIAMPIGHPARAFSLEFDEMSCQVRRHPASASMNLRVKL